jgi:hypothetical protein
MTVKTIVTNCVVTGSAMIKIVCMLFVGKLYLVPQTVFEIENIIQRGAVCLAMAKESILD